MGYYGLQDRWAKREGRVVRYVFYATTVFGSEITCHPSGQTLEEAYRKAVVALGVKPKRFKVLWFEHELPSEGWRS